MNQKRLISHIRSLSSDIGNNVNQRNLILSIIGLITLEGTIYVSSTLFRFLWTRFKQFLTLSVEITSSDDSYDKLIEWLNAQEYSKSANNLAVKTIFDRRDDQPIVFFAPAVGHHFFQYHGKWVWMNRERGNFDTNAASFSETITLSTMNYAARNLFRNMITDAIAFSQCQSKGKLIIHTTFRGRWKKIGIPEPARPMESVILDAKVKQDIIDDINRFMSNKDWYKTIGVPYRRGYLFYGPPGCGKTSFIRAIAGLFGLDICILSLSSRELNDESINYLLNDAPRRSIIVVEDIDTNLPSRQQTNNKENNNKPEQRLNPEVSH